MRTHPARRLAGADRAILVGDVKAAPLEHNVWNRKQIRCIVGRMIPAAAVGPQSIMDVRSAIR